MGEASEVFDGYPPLVDKGAADSASNSGSHVAQGAYNAVMMQAFGHDGPFLQREIVVFGVRHVLGVLRVEVFDGRDFVLLQLFQNCSLVLDMQ
jgi:hypothetical protein